MSRAVWKSRSRTEPTRHVGGPHGPQSLFAEGNAMIRKRSISLHGHRTSFSIEDAFLDELKTIAHARKISFAALIAEIDETRSPDSNLSSALRLHVLSEIKKGTPAEGPQDPSASHT